MGDVRARSSKGEMKGEEEEKRNKLRWNSK